MRALVTGGTGFIGSNLALALHEQGHEVIITGNPYEQTLPEFEGKTLYLSPLGIDWERVGPLDALFHQGAISDTRVSDRKEMLRANVETSKVFFQKAAEKGARHIVYASSTAVYGTLPAPYKESMGVAPYNVYGESKVLQEDMAGEFAQQHPDIRVVGLRYCNVYGPRESHKGKTATMIYQFAQQMQEGNPKLFKNGEQKRDYIYIRDVVAANILALEAKENVVVNCGSGAATSFNTIVSILNKTLGLSRVPEYIDNPYGDAYQSYTECDMSLAKEKLGFTPQYDIEKGIADYFASGFLTR